MTREQRRQDFVVASGWGDARLDAFPGDASSRRYARLTRGSDTAVLMDAPPAPDEIIAPADATPDARKALGYTAMARLAGTSVVPFVTIAAELTKRGFSAPHILAVDAENGFVLLEDFGSELFAPVVQADPPRERELYEAAIDVLADIYRSTFPNVMAGHGASWTVGDYDETALLAETDLCLDWYLPDAGVELSDTARAEFYTLWRQAFSVLSAHPKGLALRDFHAENLFWMPGRTPTANVGLIDFQDALFAHPTYDLVSLLEDARRDVSLDLHEGLKQRFCDAVGFNYDADFKAAYAVMGAQRNTKIIGIFVRLHARDGKAQYRDLIPRVTAHLKRDLSHPVCADLRQWFETHVPGVLA